MPNRASWPGLVDTYSGVTGNTVVDGMAKENSVAVKLSHPPLPRTQREIRKERKMIAECKW